MKHLTWEKSFQSRTSVPPLPTEPLSQSQACFFLFKKIREEDLTRFSAPNYPAVYNKA